MADKNKKHGPHGPDCNCDEDGEIIAAGVAIARCLSEILPPLLARWAEGDAGVTVDFRFDRGEEVDGIAVRARPLDGNGDWPDVEPEDVHEVNPAAEIKEFLREALGADEPRPSNGNKDYVH